MGELDQLQDSVQANPKDVAAWYSLGATYALEQNLPEAFDAFLKVVMLDREFRKTRVEKVYFRFLKSRERSHQRYSRLVES